VVEGGSCGMHGRTELHTGFGGNTWTNVTTEKT